MAIGPTNNKFGAGVVAVYSLSLLAQNVALPEMELSVLRLVYLSSALCSQLSFWSKSYILTTRFVGVSCSTSSNLLQLRGSSKTP